MSHWLLVSLSLSFALAALLVMFTPFLRDFTTLHIGAELLALGALLCGVLCSVNLSPVRTALISGVLILLFSSLIEAGVIALPALFNLVPNPVSYINVAEQQVVLGCLVAGPFVVAGFVLGGIIRARLRH